MRKANVVEALRYHLANTPKEQLEAEWKELEPWGNIGPTVEEYLYYNRPNLFGGKVFATRDELFYWDEDGHLQLNTNVRDLNGDPFSIQMGRNMDLSMCTRLLITD